MEKKLGIYIHIPFCERKCSYCGFLSFPLSDGEKNSLDDYVDCLCKEITYMAKHYSKQYIVDTIFIGGGTPSLLKPSQIVKIMTTLKDGFNISKDVEITIESNPNSLDMEKLTTYLESGINRLSMGVQSFDDEILKKIGRIHNEKIAINAFEMAKNAGFKNINIDLMFALPGQSEAIWKQTLEKAFQLKPEHLSFYSLQIEEGTRFYKSYKDEKLDVPSDEVSDNMYKTALKLIKNNKYDHYEISNCSKIGYNCKHNIKYWQMDDYLAFGLGASGYISGYRYTNPKDFNSWKQQVLNEISIEDREYADFESLEAGMSVFCFTALRTAKGIDFANFAKRFGVAFFDVYKDKIDFINEEVSKGNMILSENNLSLTADGILISNDLMCEFV